VQLDPNGTEETAENAKTAEKTFGSALSAIFAVFL